MQQFTLTQATDPLLFLNQGSAALSLLVGVAQGQTHRFLTVLAVAVVAVVFMIA
jgi:hypothetical protein